MSYLRTPFFAHSISAKFASFVFPQHVKHIPASWPLPLWSLCLKAFPLIFLCLTPSPYSCLYTNAISLGKYSLTNLTKTAMHPMFPNMYSTDYHMTLLCIYLHFQKFPVLTEVISGQDFLLPCVPST